MMIIVSSVGRLWDGVYICLVVVAGVVCKVFASPYTEMLRLAT
jgi:hypothetical protein